MKDLCSAIYLTEAMLKNNEMMSEVFKTLKLALKNANATFKDVELTYNKDDDKWLLSFVGVADEKGEQQ